MAVREVLHYPQPALKAPARPPRPDEVARVAADLVDTMRSFPRCVGVAAPQIGEPVRMCVVDVSEHPKGAGGHGLLVLVEPVVVSGSGAELGREGCLSIPDLTANVRRSLTVAVSASRVDGSALEIEAVGFEARALQHEIDPLDGSLFLDRVVSAAHVFRRRSYG